MMKNPPVCNTHSVSGCWDLLVSVLQSEKPIGLGESLKLTRIAEEYYRRSATGASQKQRKG
ncbi:MAG TPA: hypothetical protein ENJ35_05620 [Gammaproteobacteria bacterium]|nr:hypothetical protein [Gammaproteobacteria bacterium]